ncbi:hypothetical protein H0H93_006205 [Arthromyces matolae]|nr:hypothetical protein H0H93_006205 [Arthromyces matolae]
MDVPPGYNADSSNTHDEAPPHYAFPEKFEIGSLRTTAPLVTTKQVKNHLTLLNAFANLRNQVNNIRVDAQQAIPFPPLDIEKRWCWFVAMAVERFSIWCGTLKGDDSRRSAAELLPPLDVIMVWHAYMLNPRWYAEDCTRLPGLRALRDVSHIFSNSFASDLGEILTTEPSQARIEIWSSRTGRLFDPLEDSKVNHSRPVICPYCKSLTITPYVTAIGTGFVQTNFAVECSNPGCRARITRSLLAARKLLEDLAKKVANGKAAACLPSVHLILRPPMLMAYSLNRGTLRTNGNPADAFRAKTLRDLVFKATIFSGRPSSKKGPYAMEQWMLLVLQKANSDFNTLWSNVAAALVPKAKTPTLLARIKSAYESPYIFSVELVGAGSFVTKMHDLQWTQPGFFDSAEDEVALQHAIARYHGFLDLMTASPVSFYVPTLDIDLAWHTHQLMGEKYNDDCMDYIGRYIDHDDRIEENALSNAFEMTCRAWKDRFGLPYTHCGCPLPGTTIGQRITRLVLFMKQERSYLVPLPREDLRAATHPSDHNAIFLWQSKHAGLDRQDQRRSLFYKRKHRDEEKRRRGQLPPLTPNEERHLDIRAAAFFIPVPLVFGFADSGGCAAYAGNMVDITTGSGMAACAMLGTCATTSGGGGGGGSCGGGSGGGDAGGGGGGGGCGGCGGGCGGG